MLVVLAASLIFVGLPLRSLALEVLPSIDAIDIAGSIAESKYKEAARNAQKAFLIQSGIKSRYDIARNAVHQRATNIESKAVDKTLSLVDQFIPVNREYVLFTAGGVYTVIVKKSYQHSFTSPLCRDLVHYIKWSPDVTETGITFHF